MPQKGTSPAVTLEANAKQMLQHLLRQPLNPRPDPAPLLPKEGGPGERLRLSRLTARSRLPRTNPRRCAAVRAVTP